MLLNHIHAMLKNGVSYYAKNTHILLIWLNCRWVGVAVDDYCAVSLRQGMREYSLWYTSLNRQFHWITLHWTWNRSSMFAVGVNESFFLLAQRCNTNVMNRYDEFKILIVHMNFYFIFYSNFYFLFIKQMGSRKVIIRKASAWNEFKLFYRIDFICANREQVPENQFNGQKNFKVWYFNQFLCFLSWDEHK